MWNAKLDEAHAGIKISGRTINNLRYSDGTTLMAESKEELKSERGEWKSWLKTQHLKTKFMASCSFTLWQIDGEKMETVTDFTFLDSKITVDSDCSHEIKKRCSLEEKQCQT